MFKIEDGRLSFWQWDLNQRLIVDDASITEVHFCHKIGDCSLVCEVYEEDGKRLVNVPNILLQDNWTIRVYAYCVNYTKIEEKINVFSRSKPADYIYTETEIKTFARLENRMDELEATVSVEGIAKAVEDYLIANPVEAGATTEEREQIEQNKEDIEVLQAQSAHYALKSEIPSIKGLATEAYVDAAISGIDIPKVDLTNYATKEHVATEIAKAQLEGGEVDLSDYATKEYVDSAIGNIDIPEGNLGVGLTVEEKSLMLTLYQNTLYATDVSAVINRLQALWRGNEESTIYIISSNLENVISSNPAGTVKNGESYTATLTALEGYKMELVTITMGGADVTDSVYNNGIVFIGSVTGAVVVTAKATPNEIELVWIPNKTLDNNGLETTNIGSITDFIDRTGYTTLTATANSNYTGWSTISLMAYDADKNFLSKVSHDGYFGQNYNPIITLQIPDNAIYIRVSVYNSKVINTQATFKFS